MFPPQRNLLRGFSARACHTVCLPDDDAHNCPTPAQGSCTDASSWVPRCCLCLGAETSLGLIAHVCEAMRRALFNRSAARRTFPRRHRAAQRSGHSRAGIPAASLDPSVGPGRLARVDPGNGSCRMPVVSLDPTLGACLRVPSVVPSGTRVGIAATVLLDPLVRAT
jgi:hypothetical protein